ncbi:MAG: GAF and ANTAR domain-containing protein [Marmoricola sp.]
MSREAAEDFAEMALRLHDEPTVTETVELVLEYALKAVGCDYAGVIFVHGGTRVETIAATDPLIVKLDALQMEHREGPDLEALDDRLSVMVDDTRTEARWPRWAEKVASEGIRSMLCMRLYTTESIIGTLNLYSREPRQFDLDDQAVAHILARHAAVAIGAARKEENLWQAVDARKRIGQAQGILMERFDLTPDQAFAVLLRYSQDNNVKLRTVADKLVDTRTLPS